ncbi:MAG: type II secretion system F family protein [Acidimicrobiia bacterium]
MVNALVMALLGGAAGCGLLLVVMGARGRRILGSTGAGAGRSLVPTEQLVLRLACALGAAVGVALVTKWPVAAASAGVVGYGLPNIRAAAGRHQREISRVEAIASWTEQLRDTLSAANGLEHAITAGARLAPGPLELPVARMAARLQYQPLAEALREFAVEVDHPLADFVAAALVMAAEREARELGPLLGHLAECARDDARMRSRVWVGRARTRTAVRIIGGVVVASVGALYLIDRHYLAPYGSVSGQIVLLVVVGLFAGALVAMDRMGRIAMPERFVGRRVTAAGQ